VIDCNERKTEKRHKFTNMGKVKQLELWWQLYLSLPEWDVWNIMPLDFCWTECTYTTPLRSIHRTIVAMEQQYILNILSVRLYTKCPGRNMPDFGRMFLTLKYTDITQNTYIQSWTVTELIAREVWKYDSCYTLIDY